MLLKLKKILKQLNLQKSLFSEKFHSFDENKAYLIREPKPKALISIFFFFINYFNFLKNYKKIK